MKTSNVYFNAATGGHQPATMQSGDKRNLSKGEFTEMKVFKKLTSKSGITIPKQLRAELGFAPGMAVDMETTDKGVLVRKHRPACRFCARDEDVITVAHMEVCRACARVLKQEVEQHGI